ncbi:MAG: heme-copper oxidase subunit III [Pseudomonadota bacterium]|nr:heme-copper oxidase subunit III [Pseudomonadota bacterium]
MSSAAAHHSSTSMGVDNYKLAMWTFLGSECFFFGSLIGTYMSYRGKSLTGPYPLDVFDPAVTSISTFDLLASSLFMVLAVHYAKAGEINKMLGWVAATMVGGLIFLGFQYYEFSHFVHEGLTLKSNLFGATFYVLTGFHGTHVAVGVLLLGSLAWSAKRGHLANIGETTEVIGLYWHFVDVVWIVIFTLVYLLEYT